jgi:glycosyltransferase involved in cell wall biosynthesis
MVNKTVGSIKEPIGITLVNDNIGYIGDGIPAYTQDLYNNLLEYGINAEKVSISDYVGLGNPHIPGMRTFKKRLFLLSGAKPLKNKNIHAMSPTILSYSVLRKAKAKIVTVHDLYDFNPDFQRQRLSSFHGIQKFVLSQILRMNRNLWKYLPLYDRVFAISEETKKGLIDRFNIDSSKISVAYPFIPDKFKPLDIDRNKTVIGYINNFNFNKRGKMKVFIEAFKEVEGNDLEFHIYGRNFPFADLIKDDERIKYLGFLPEDKVVKTINSFSAYLSTSIVEGFGIPIMQAKSCKIPVLCYDGDIPDITKRNTLLWDDGSIRSILESREWEKADVGKGFKDAELCRPSKTVPAMIKTYREVL